MSFKNLFADFSIISALAISFCYFVGWFLIYFFLQEFDIEILQIEIPQLYFLFYSYAVIERLASEAWNSFIPIIQNIITHFAIGILVCIYLIFKYEIDAAFQYLKKITPNSIIQFSLLILVQFSFFYYGYDGAYRTAGLWAKEVRLGNQNQLQLTMNDQAGSRILHKIISRKISLKRSRCLADREQPECIEWGKCQELIKLHGVYRIGEYNLSTIIADSKRIFVLYQPKCGSLVKITRASQASVIELKYEDISTVTHNLAIISDSNSEGVK